jgi:hypothetical protein
MARGRRPASNGGARDRRWRRGVAIGHVYGRGGSCNAASAAARHGWVDKEWLSPLPECQP